MVRNTSISIALATVLATSCASEPLTSSDTSKSAGPEASLTSNGARSEATGSGQPTTADVEGTLPVPPGPKYPCGVHDAAEAVDLVQLGDSRALVEATITDSPTDTGQFNLEIPVASFELLAGSLPQGPVELLSEPAVVPNFLPPGTYLLLLGDAGERGTYFVSDGRRGSFLVQDNSAFEQCPDLATGGGKLATTGVTSLSELTAVLAKAVEGS